MARIASIVLGCLLVSIASVAFLSDSAVMTRLAAVLGVNTGLNLVVIGAGGWAPLARR